MSSIADRLEMIQVKQFHDEAVEAKIAATTNVASLMNGSMSKAEFNEILNAAYDKSCHSVYSDYYVLWVKKITDALTMA